MVLCTFKSLPLTLNGNKIYCQASKGGKKSAATKRMVSGSANSISECTRTKKTGKGSFQSEGNPIPHEPSFVACIV